MGENPSDDALLAARLIPDPRRVRLRVYQTNSTHKSMSAIRQGSMLLVKDVDFREVEAQFHEAVFTHASTSPNQQLIASLDVARRQMELEGYGLVMNAIEIALKIRAAIKNNPLISKYFRVLGADGMIPAQYRQSGFSDYLADGVGWGDVVRAMREDEFYLDPTRITLVCGTAGFDGTEFKGVLANEYGIQVNKTSRNSVLIQSNINNTRSDVAHLIRVLVEICHGIENRLASGGEGAKEAFAARVKSLMTDVPRPAELQPVPRRVPQASGQVDAGGRHPRRLLRRLQRGGLRIRAAVRRRMRPATARGAGHGVGQLRHSLPAGLPDHGAGSGPDPGNDRLHAQARCEGDPRLRARARAEAAAASRNGRPRSRLRLTDIGPHAAPGQSRSGIGPGVTTMQAFFSFLAANPYILLFLTVGLAVWIGRQTIGGYGLGMVAAAIIVGCGLSVWASTYGDEARAEQLHAAAVLLPVHVRGRAAGRPFLRQQPGRGRDQVQRPRRGELRDRVGPGGGRGEAVRPSGRGAGGMLAGSQTMSAAIGSAEQAVLAGVVKPLRAARRGGQRHDRAVVRYHLHLGYGRNRPDHEISSAMVGHRRAPGGPRLREGARSGQRRRAGLLRLDPRQACAPTGSRTRCGKARPCATSSTSIPNTGR